MDQVQQQIEDARRVLYDIDPVNGNTIGKSKLYRRYEKNAANYAKAKSGYAAAYAKAQSDPVALQVWPLTGVTYRQAIDSAWDDWIIGMPSSSPTDASSSPSDTTSSPSSDPSPSPPSGTTSPSPVDTSSTGPDDAATTSDKPQT
jgi:hypothetical protein